MTISTIAGAAGTTAVTATAPTSRNQLGEKDFLLLLTTQLKQQDPTSPVDNKEMLAQMAQFSSLSGITEMSATLKRIADQIDQVVATASPAAVQSTGAAFTTPIS
jgi:flagellar basal-body rod modification protein FlgD